MWNKRFNRPLLWAMVVSALLHILLIGRLSGLQWPQDETRSLLIELAPVALVPPPQSLPRPQPRAERRPEQVLKPPAQFPEVRTPPPVNYAVPEETFPESTQTGPEPVAEAMEPIAAQPEQPVPPMPLAEETAEVEEQPAAAQEAAVETLPNFVAIDFNIMRKGSVVGIENHVYDYGDNGYTLTSIAKPKGLYALALSELTQKSEGKVTSQGLRPDRFLYQYGKNSDKTQRAFFDWNKGVLFMQTGTRKQEAPLREGAQDLMSFMYQFMFEPPLQQMQLAITNGKRFRTYDYVFEGEETIETPLGKISSLHIARSSDDGEEKTELWLAADYHYLPLKFRKTEKDGTVLERIATHVQME